MKQPHLFVICSGSILFLSYMWELWEENHPLDKKISQKDVGSRNELDDSSTYSPYFRKITRHKINAVVSLANLGLLECLLVLSNYLLSNSRIYRQANRSGNGYNREVTQQNENRETNFLFWWLSVFCFLSLQKTNIFMQELSQWGEIVTQIFENKWKHLLTFYIQIDYATYKKHIFIYIDNTRLTRLGESSS